MSPIPQDKALVDATRTQLSAVPLAQRVYNRLRQRGLGSDFPEFTVAKAGGGNAPLVFVRASGLPLTRGVPGLFTFNGYHKGFQSVVGEATAQLASEQGWVLGLSLIHISSWPTNNRRSTTPSGRWTVSGPSSSPIRAVGRPGVRRSRRPRRCRRRLTHPTSPMA